MDFSYLLDLAKQNEQHAKEAVQVKRYSTQVSLAKKEPRSLVQSRAIQTFLAKKEQEEKKKQLDDKRKKEKLLSIRAQDRKSNARVQAMVKRSKAANKAVLNNLNNALDTNVASAGLDVQPDEDDYGYVSHEASELYKKLLNKYNSGTQTSEKSDRNKLRKTQQELSNSKNRVKDALHEIRQQESSGHQKGHSSKASVVVHKSRQNSNSKQPGCGKDVTPKKDTRLKGPPPEAALSFDQILKLAATKQHEPIKFEKKSDEVEKRVQESERLMTQKERDDLMRKKQQDMDRQLRKAKTTEIVPPVPGPTTLNSKNNNKPASTVSVAKKTPSAETSKHRAPSTDGRSTSSLSVSRDSKSIRVKTAGTAQPGRTLPMPKIAAPSGQTPSRGAVAKGQPSSLPSRENGSKGKSLSSHGGSRPIAPSYRGIRPVARTFKRPMESDEEEDSDLDDFIDDGPDGEDDYSKHIKEIFGYDRTRYRRIESDDEGECMESSYAQQMKEERISAKIGIMEDLEEERRLQEEEERKKKNLKKAKTKK